MGNVNYSHSSLPGGGYSLLLRIPVESLLTTVTIITALSYEHSQCITHRGRKTDHGIPFHCQEVARVRCVIIIIFMQNVTLGSWPDGWWLSRNATLDYLLSLGLQWALSSSCFCRLHLGCRRWSKVQDGFPWNLRLFHDNTLAAGSFWG